MSSTRPNGARGAGLTLDDPHQPVEQAGLAPGCSGDGHTTALVFVRIRSRSREAQTRR